jgi:hypothetical protein
MEAAQVDQVLQAWRQGDCVLGDFFFTHLAVREKRQRGWLMRLLSALQNTDNESQTDLIDTPIEGFVALSQTCDLVRASLDRPYVEVCPLVEVPQARLPDVQRGRLPQYVFIPALAERRLVGDLDRVMTIEKSVVATWERTAGCGSDQEARHFALAAGRKRTRFAFPDDFTDHVKKLRDRLIGKHDKNSAEGVALRGLREIRVSADPSWDDPQVSLMYWFVHDDQSDEFANVEWDEWLEKWLALVPSGGRYTEVNGQVTSLARMTAEEYVFSDPLDLDHLSRRASS